MPHTLYIKTKLNQQNTISCCASLIMRTLANINFKAQVLKQAQKSLPKTSGGLLLLEPIIGFEPTTPLLRKKCGKKPDIPIVVLSLDITSFTGICHLHVFAIICVGLYYKRRI